MLIGPDRSASLLEVGVATAEGIDFIVHAMTARPRFLELADASIHSGDPRPR